MFPVLVLVSCTLPEVKVPPRSCNSPEFVNIPALPLKVLPVPMVKMPALLNAPAVVKFRPFWMVKCPAAALVAK